MSRLIEAAAKLESAVDRIEAAVVRSAGNRSPEPVGSESGGPEADGQERLELQSTIDQVRQENAGLKQSVGNAQGRLDHAIDRIRTMLGE